jgi:hypothetical protein
MAHTKSRLPGHAQVTNQTACHFACAELTAWKQEMFLLARHGRRKPAGSAA